MRQSAHNGRAAAALAARSLVSRALALVLCLCSSAGATVRLAHEAPAMAAEGAALELRLSVVGEFEPELLATADVVVEGAGGATHIALSISSRNEIRGEVPASLVKPPSLSYYFRLVDAEGEVVLLPPGAPGGGLFSVDVLSVGDEGEALPRPGAEHTPGVEILVPRPGEVLEEVRPLFAVLFDPPLDEPLDVLALVDGVEVTRGIDAGPDGLVVAPGESLPDGPHDVTLAVLTPTRREEATWTFYVRDTEPPPGAAGLEGSGAGLWSSEGEWVLGEVPGDARPSEFEVHGRMEVGWAAVFAETTAVDTADVYLPYDEVSRPTLDAYASGSDGVRSFLLTAQYDPVYDDDLAWSLSMENRTFGLEVGDVYPTLSRTTLDWAAGEGAVLSARLGRTATELVAMRVSEADTAGGFGIYSRFALGARETFSWGERSSASVVYLYAFDREGSVAEAQQLSEPLENSVAAGAVSLGFGRITVDLEAAGSDARGEVEGSGAAGVARVSFTPNARNRASLEFVTSEPSFYSAGSLEHEPGETGLKAEFTARPSDGLSLSGYAGAYRNEQSAQGIDPDGYELRTYGRADATREALGGALRGYCVVRYDRVPYETYDYTYIYSNLGASYRRGRTRAALSGSWSRSDSEGVSRVSTAGGEVLFDLVPRRLSLRLNARFSFGTSYDESSDYVRTSVTGEVRYDGGGFDVTGEYRLLDLDDRAAPAESYTENVFRIGVGRVF